jgi:hypothetical protein
MKPTEFAEIPFSESIDLVSTKEGDAIGIDFRFTDPETSTPRLVRAWATLQQAAILSAQLASICRQFGVEPPSGKQTMQ